MQLLSNKIKKTRAYKVIVHLVIPLVIVYCTLYVVHWALGRWPVLDRFWVGIGFIAVPAVGFGVMLYVMNLHEFTGEDDEKET